MNKIDNEQLKREFGFDLYGRYAIIQDIINQNRKSNEKFRILDVGGRGNILSKFLPNDEVFYIDPFVESNDKNFIKGDGCDMLLDNESFDWVTSADVFEHILKDKRRDFLKENLRVAKIGVVLAAPFYSKEVEQAEINANENYKILSNGNDHLWLKEHIQNGLPTMEFIENFLNERKIQFQKIHNNRLFLWQTLIGFGFLASDNQYEFIDEKIKKFNYSYNTDVFPFDNQDPSYRKIYFIKKISNLKNIKTESKVIDSELFLKTIKNSFDLAYDIYNLNKNSIQQKEQEILNITQNLQQKEQEIILIKSSKFWKLRNAYLIFKSKMLFSFANPSKIINKLYKKIAYLWHSFDRSRKAEGNKIAIIRLLNFVLHGKGAVAVQRDCLVTSIKNENIFENITRYSNDRTTITSFVPFDFTPANFGGGVRIMSVYSGLSKFFNVNLVAIGGLGSYFKHIMINENFNIYVVPMSQSFYDKMVAEEKIAGGHLHDILITEEFEKLPELCEFTDLIKNETDIFISSHPYFFNLIKKYGNDKIKVYEAHNVDYVLKHSYFPDWKNNEKARKYLKMVRDIEEVACVESDFVMAVSSYDAKQLVETYKFDEKKIVVVPNGIDVSAFKFNLNPAILDRKTKNVLFVGSAHGPNIEAVEFIVSDLAPKDSSIQYFIMGNIKNYFKDRKVLPKNVNFLGLVDEEKKKLFYEKSDLAINPMFSGSGTNIKVLEYAASGIPVVSTVFGMRGLEPLNDSILFAEKDEFLKAIQSFFSLNKKEIENKVKSGRAACEKEFAKEVIVKNFVNCIKLIEDKIADKHLNNKLIAIEGRILHRNISGTERYIFELLQNVPKNSDKEYSYCLVGNDKISSDILGKNIDKVSRISVDKNVDLYHRTYQFGNSSELVEMFLAKRSVFTFHDLILCKYPEYFENLEKYNKYVEYMKIGLQFSDRVIAISEDAKRDIINTFGVVEDKIDVVYHGIDRNKFFQITDEKKLSNFRDKYNLPEKYILFIGTDYPHKNLKNLYIAFEKLLKEKNMKDVYLVIAGSSYFHDKHYLDRYLKPIKNNVISIGYVEDYEMNLLYSAARVFVFPSLYEGFGFPVLEAFSCGVPVVCSKATSLPEVAGEAACLVDATNPKEMSTAISSVLENHELRKKLIESGLERVNEFTWDKSAKQTFLTYKKALESDSSVLKKDSKEFKKLLESIIY